MDPRNPLGRLDHISRDSGVKELRLVFMRRDDGSVARKVEYVTARGVERSISMKRGWSYVDLLDRLGRALSTKPHRNRI